MRKRYFESADSGKCECCSEPKEDCTCPPDCPDCDCKKDDKKTEGFTFDKFMDSIIIAENKRSPMKTMHDSPQRTRAMRNQERPLGRIIFGSNT